MTAPCERIASELGARFVCSEHDGRYVRIRTPFLYPDGDVIDLFLHTRTDGTAALTDLGESVRWLRGQSLSPRRTPKQRQLIEDVCLNHGVEFFRGMLVARVPDMAALADASLRVAQAALRISDLWFTFRTRAVESVTEEVSDYLTEHAIAFDRDVKLAGRSGRAWTIDLQTRTPDRSALVCVLATGSRAAARGVTEHVVAAWHDLNHLAAGPEALHFVSLFDDTSDVWMPEDFRLVESLSDVARWSRPDEFERTLRRAA